LSLGIPKMRSGDWRGVNWSSSFVKVLDFGLVKLDRAGRSGPDPVNLSAEESWSGTPGYIAPEVVLGSCCAPLRLRFQGGAESHGSGMELRGTRAGHLQRL
jgi:hypothetical protein